MAKMVMGEGATFKAATARFEVSGKTVAKWVRRYRELGLAGLGDLSSRPHRSPRQTPSALVGGGRSAAVSLHALSMNCFEFGICNRGGRKRSSSRQAIGLRTV